MLSVGGIFKKGTAFPVEKIEGRENQSVIITFLEDEAFTSDHHFEQAGFIKLMQL